MAECSIATTITTTTMRATTTPVMATAGHGHDHTHGATDKTRVLIAAALTGGFMVAEAIGGFLTGSLALVADAGHMLDRLHLAGARLVRLPPRRPRRDGAAHLWLRPRQDAGRLHQRPCHLRHRAVDRLRGAGSASSSRRRCSAGRCWWWRSPACWSTSPASTCCMAATAAASTCAARSCMCWATCWARLARSSRRWSSWRPAGRRSTRSCRCWSSLLILSTAWSLMRDAAHVLLEGAPPELDRDGIASDIVANVRACARSTTCMCGRSTARRPWRRCMPA